MEIIGTFFIIFLLVLPFLIINLFQKIKDANFRINKLNEIVDALRDTIEQTEKGTAQAKTSKDVEQTKEVKVIPSPVTTMAVEQTEILDTEIVPQITSEVSIHEPSELVSEKIPFKSVEQEEIEVKREQAPTFDIGERIKQWLLGGNTVARVGVIILFFGVAFFLQYAVDRGWLPIEVRLISAAVGGMILIALGWKLRSKRPNYALVLQGGGIGIVYLTVFASVTMYELLPVMPGLILMVTLVVLSSALAVLQDARSLAMLAAAAGFLAPVLISRGGSHVTLFSYYAILDAGILAIAWFKTWRELNLMGFLFTFVIGMAWGYQYYQPEYFTSTEPFLILFFLFYVAVPILFAQRQPPNLKGYVDGSLIFGVPLVGFGLQSSLVSDFEYGLAISALVMGLFYAILATALWQQRQEYLRMLVEVFISLAVAFGTVAIPLAVDGRWTGVAWALEGAALVWIGIRQNRWLARISGVLIQFGAGAAFFIGITEPTANVPILNSFYLGALMVSIAGLFTAFQLFRFGKQLEPAVETSTVMLIWALLWWFGAGWHELELHVDHIYHYTTGLVFVALSMAGIAYLKCRLAWSYLAKVVLLLLPFMVGVILYSYNDPSVSHPFANWGFPAWLIAFFIQYWILKNFEVEWDGKIKNYWHLGTFWLLIFNVTWEAVWLVSEAMPAAYTWHNVIWAIVPTLVIALLPATRRILTWPLQDHETIYLGAGLFPILGLVTLWTIYASFQDGDPTPLHYILIINPLELTQLFVLITSFLWIQQRYIKMDIQTSWYVWYSVAFLVLNSIIARAAHFYGNIPFEIYALWQSPRYQAAVSITWTLMALIIMVSSTRLKQRFTWIIGSVLLGAVVIKLFLVDLADIGTIPRIVSFIVVGLLILLTGYLSPLPPKEKE